MYQIRVRHNYIHKLIAELSFHIPEALYQFQDDAVITDDYSIVEVAEYVFQFQPELLVVDYFVTNSEMDSGSRSEDEAFLRRTAFAMKAQLAVSS